MNVKILPTIQKQFICKLRYFLVVGSFTVLFSTNLWAQYTKLKDFLSDNGNNISSPNGDLVSDGTFFYGMTTRGGNYGGSYGDSKGSIFKIGVNGSGFQKLLDFDGANKGSRPKGSLVLSGTTLYGMTTNGGTHDKGTIFKINTDGTGFQKLIDFDGVNSGAYPYGSLTLSGTMLYGMTANGGTSDKGVIFKMNTDGTGFQKMLDFDGTNKGSWPQGSLLLSGSVLYGTTSSGGTGSYGVIFKINADGTGFGKLHNFTGYNEGAIPKGSLIVSDTVLYGTTWSGTYDSNSGTIFRINVNGSNFKNLANLRTYGYGMYPEGSLTLSGSSLYGMAPYNNQGENGIIFKINKDGSGFQKVYDFDGTNSGANPFGSLTLMGTDLCGMTSSGGASGNGVIFKINSVSLAFTKIMDLTLASAGAGDVITDGTMVYGTTSQGGSSNVGTIYKMGLDGTQFKKLYDFDGPINGNSPASMLTKLGNTLYGATSRGGTNDAGVIFKINTDGTGFKKLTDFDGTNGSDPNGSLILLNSALYGTTWGGGTNDNGIIFKIKTDGTGFQKLVDLDNYQAYGANSLITYGSVLYGAATWGGTNEYGFIFKVDTMGNNFQKLWNFDGKENGAGPNPFIISNGLIYGTASYGGIHDTIGSNDGDGIIYKVKTDGTGFKKLHDFDKANGMYPGGSLTLSGTTLYGVTNMGGANDTTMSGPGDGVMFKINTDGTGFQKLLDFDGINNGLNPGCTFALFNEVLYGTTGSGGAENLGTVFKYNLKSAPPSSVQPVLLKTEMYPNPVQDNLTINLEAIWLPATVSVYSMNGIQILQTNAVSSPVQINMANVEQGVYVIKIITPEGLVVKKVVKR